MGLIPGLGRYLGEGHGNPFQYSCQENPMDRGAWLATVHWVAQSDTTEVTEHARTLYWSSQPGTPLAQSMKSPHLSPLSEAITVL